MKLKKKKMGDEATMRLNTAKKTALARPTRTTRGALHKNQLQLYSLLAIPVLLVFVFCYLPMVGIIIAFKDYRYNSGIFGSKWCGLKNFEFFFKSDDFLKITWNTLYLNFLFITFGIFFALVVAILLYDVKKRAAVKTFQTVLITPYFLSWVVVSYMVYGFLSPQNGLLNSLLQSMGMETYDWYSKPDAWPAILVMLSIWKNVGMDSVIYYAALMSIDDSLFEAADLDGAGRFQKILHITIPSLVPIIIITAILKIGNIFRADFGLFYQITRDSGALYDVTDVIDTYIFRTMRTVGNMGMSTAVGFLQGIVGMVMVIVTNKLSKRIDPDAGLF